MIQFILQAFKSDECFHEETALPQDVLDCFEWMEQRSVEESNECREKMTCYIEELGQKLWASGEVKSWGAAADAQVASVTTDVNGPLFEHLLSAVRHEDLSCASMFRDGAQLLGKLPATGNFAPERSGRTSR